MRNSNKSFLIFCDNYEYTKYYNDRTSVSYNVEYVYDYLCRNKILRFFYKIHRRLFVYGLLPLSTLFIWFGPMLKKVYKSPHDSCIIIFATLLPYIPYGVLKRIKNSNRDIVIQYTDTVKSLKDQVDINKLRLFSSLILTYNSNDAIEYNLNLSLPQVPLIKNEDTPVEKTIDVFYIGQDKWRFKLIEDVYMKCVNEGLKCDFNIVGPTKVKNPGIHKINPLGYKDVLKKVACSKALLNIMQPGSNGITLRDIEAYNYGLYIITNNESEDLLEILHREQIIKIGSEDFSAKIKQIRERRQAFAVKESSFSFDNYYESILSLLDY